MKEVNLLLEDDEIMILRGQARFMAMMPEAFGSGGGEELITNYVDKILKATTHIDEDYKKEIGKMQRALRAIKETPLYPMIISVMTNFNQALIQEIQKQNPDL